MNKTKKKILDKALLLFNEQGVSNVSIRQLAKEIGMSHGNLIYHFKTKGDIISSLHDELLDHAFQINQHIDRLNFDISNLYQTTLSGFGIVYDFRFLFFDLLYISNSVPNMREALKKAEKIRSEMYAEVISLSIQNGLMRQADYEEEYSELIKRIKVFSDHWISSASIYETQEKDQLLREYSTLFMGHFYPYLTQKGKKGFSLR